MPEIRPDHRAPTIPGIVAFLHHASRSPLMTRASGRVRSQHIPWTENKGRRLGIDARLPLTVLEVEHEAGDVSGILPVR